MELNEAAIMGIRELAYTMENAIKQIDRLEQDLEFEKHRGAGLADDKIKLAQMLDKSIEDRSWNSISDGQCPDGVRVMVKGKNDRAVFATLNAGTWLNNRMLLEFSPTHWMQVPE